MTELHVSTWGDPNATKRVLLLHGITASSQVWYRIAHEFASQGYFVTAPDLLGHGDARRSSVYTIAALAQELSPLLKTPEGNDHPYHIVVGHSLGGVLASALLSLLKSTRSVQVILVDPPLELAPGSVAFYRKEFGNEVRNPKTPEAYRQKYPFMTREDSIFTFLSLHLCDAAAVEAIFDQNVPWSFSHQLLTAPDNVKVTVLAADPSKGPCVREEDLKPYPHVTAKTVWGASHLIPMEAPQAIVETALQGAESPNQLEYVPVPCD